MTITMRTPTSITVTSIHTFMRTGTPTRAHTDMPTSIPTSITVTSIHTFTLRSTRSARSE